MPPRPQPRSAATARAALDDAMDQGIEDEGRLSPGPDNLSSGQPGGQGAAEAAAGPDGGPPKPARAPRKQDPKLDLDLLEAEGGFNDIWHKMAPAFKATFQGAGHEVADLRRLLELYQRWQMRFYPHCDFDTFVLKLEKAGRSKIVKAKMNSMRQNLLGLIFPVLAEDAADIPQLADTQQQTQAAAGAPARAANATTGPAAAGGGALLPEDDDELVALQREADWEAAYAAMDELEASGQEQRRQRPPDAYMQPAAARGGTAAMDVDPELEELMALAEEAHGRQQQQQTGIGSGAGGREPGGTASVYGNPDEELIALAMEYENDAAAASLAPEGAVRPSSLGAGVAMAGSGAGMARGGGGVVPGAPEELQLGVVVDEDEELRQFAAMDTTEAEVAAGGLMRGAGGGAEAGAGGALMGVDGEQAGAHGSSAGRHYAGTADLDEELIALAAIDTQGGGSVAAAAVGLQQYGGTPELDEELMALAAGGTQGGDSAAAVSLQQYGGTAQLDEELMALAAIDTQRGGGSDEVPYDINDEGARRPDAVCGSGAEVCGSNAGGGAEEASAGGDSGALRRDESQAVEVELEGSQAGGMLLRGILMSQDTQQSQ